MNMQRLFGRSLTAQDFLQHLIEFNVITKAEAEKEYAEAIYGKCRYFAPWFIVSVAGANPTIHRKFIIHEGRVQGRHHVWLEYDGKYFIDGTIAQFLPEKTNIEVFAKTDVEDLYHTEATYFLAEWFDREEQSEF